LCTSPLGKFTRTLAKKAGDLGADYTAAEHANG
jgi:hypothetical protein